MGGVGGGLGGVRGFLVYLRFQGLRFVFWVSGLRFGFEVCFRVV